ncbi:MAG: biotin/lipoyl-binding protein, partial [Acidobacteria bacterium]|nr:biotin/lipoyl-binding protein [Acidobacteriota bacterium]
MTEFKLPELGENVHQGDLVRLMVTPGSTVSEGQAVIELETDKAVVEVPSSVSGTVKDVLVKQGQKITVGQVIFTIENGAGAQRADTRAAPLPGEDGGSAATAGGGADREKPAQPARVPLTSSRPAAS